MKAMGAEGIQRVLRGVEPIQLLISARLVETTKPTETPNTVQPAPLVVPWQPMATNKSLKVSKSAGTAHPDKPDRDVLKKAKKARKLAKMATKAVDYGGWDNRKKEQAQTRTSLQGICC